MCILRSVSVCRVIQVTLNTEHALLITTSLYFTTFPHPPPPQDSLNTIYGSSDRLPPVRNPILSTSSQGAAKSYTASHYFTFDNALLYNSFYKDWGPLNLAMVYKACILIHELHCVRRAFAVDYNLAN